MCGTVPREPLASGFGSPPRERSWARCGPPSEGGGRSPCVRVWPMPHSEPTRTASARGDADSVGFGETCDEGMLIDWPSRVLPGRWAGPGRERLAAARAVRREREPADHAAADPLGERSQIGRRDRSGRQERRRGVTARFGSSRATASHPEILSKNGELEGGQGRFCPACTRSTGLCPEFFGASAEVPRRGPEPGPRIK
jgi:hypothetical protein